MHSSLPGSPGGNGMRIMIVDDHEISRAAIRALLRAEGADVVADLRACGDALTAARALCPEMVIVDVTPEADAGFGVARQLRRLPAPPLVVLTSSAERTQFSAEVNSYLFIAKADISAAGLASLASTRGQAGPVRRRGGRGGR